MTRLPIIVAIVAISVVAFAQSRIDVENVAGGLEREQVQTALEAKLEVLDGCFADVAGSVLVTLRVSRSGRVASVRVMESSGTEAVDRCISRALRAAELGRSSGRSTAYVRVTRE